MLPAHVTRDILGMIFGDAPWCMSIDENQPYTSNNLEKELVGKVLTIIAAAVPDPVQQKALKDIAGTLVRTAFRRIQNDFNYAIEFHYKDEMAAHHKAQGTTPSA